MKKTMMNIFIISMLLLSLLPIIVSASAPNIQVSLLNYDPRPAKAGDIVDVRLRIENVGDAEAKNLVIQARPEYPFTPLSEDEKQQSIASLPSFPDRDRSTTVSFKFRIDKDAGEGFHDLEFGYSITKGTSWTTKKFSIETTSRQFAGIYLDKTKLSPGKETDMTFTITNQGSAPLQNLIFSWSEPTGIILPVSTDNTRYIKYVEAGESVPLKYSVLASNNAKPDLYPLELKLEYDIGNANNQSKTSVTTKVGIFVGGETDFDVSFSESAQGQTSLSVANIGSNPALSVTVRVPQQDSFVVQGSPSSIIGNLDKGDYTIVSFQIQPSMGDSRNMTRTRDSAGQQQTARPVQQSQRSNDLRVLIDYTDTTGERKNIEKFVPMQLRSFGNFTGVSAGFRGQRTTQTTSIWGSYVTWLVILLIAGAVYLYFNKDLRKKLLSKLIKK